MLASASRHVSEYCGAGDIIDIYIQDYLGSHLTFAFVVVPATVSITLVYLMPFPHI